MKVETRHYYHGRVAIYVDKKPSTRKCKQLCRRAIKACPEHVTYVCVFADCGRMANIRVFEYNR